MDPIDKIGKATFAAGCFWDLEAALANVEGVLETVTGYTGGSVPDPTYEEVERGTTGHVEAVGIVFDPAIVSYDQLLEIFWNIHDPTDEGGQGDYTGSQYRSMIFYHCEEQKTAALRSLDHLRTSEKYRCHPIRTAIHPAATFWQAEECHQRFYEKCGQGYGASRQIE